MRADNLLLQAWRRARGRLVSAEGFLEDALAAALEHPTVWPCLMRHLGWQDYRLPVTQPNVRTQHAGDFGRTDIELEWPGKDAPTLILELKVQAPPGPEQVGAYLARDGVLLAAVAAWPNTDELRAGLPPQQAGRLLRVITWAQIRRLECDSSPLVLRQLQRLIDAMEVAVPHVERQQLAGLVLSLPVWKACDAWIPAGLADVRRIWEASGLPSSRPRGPKLESGWYAGWLDLPLPGGTWGTLWAGLILNDPNIPPLTVGLPDLALQLEGEPSISSWGIGRCSRPAQVVPSCSPRRISTKPSLIGRGARLSPGLRRVSSSGSQRCHRRLISQLSNERLTATVLRLVRVA